MNYMFCANGLEETEALCTLDILRRAGLTVMTVGVPDKLVKGAHGIEFYADITLEEFASHPREARAVVLPGGGVGTQTLRESKIVGEFVVKTAEKGGLVCAICAAPSVLGSLGLLKNVKATCYPGFEKYLTGAECTAKRVVSDKGFVTARGMGCSVDFGLRIVAELCGDAAAEKLKTSIIY